MSTDLTLWHGTTRSAAAERITERGFEPTDTVAIVRDVARAHRMSAAPVLDMLKTARRYVHVQHRRDASVLVRGGHLGTAGARGQMGNAVRGLADPPRRLRPSSRPAGRSQRCGLAPVAVQ